jgi:hypothetical protein
METQENADFRRSLKMALKIAAVPTAGIAFVASEIANTIPPAGSAILLPFYFFNVLAAMAREDIEDTKYPKRTKKLNIKFTVPCSAPEQLLLSRRIFWGALGASFIAFAGFCDIMRKPCGVPDDATFSQVPYYLKLSIALNVLRARNAPVQKQIDGCFIGPRRCPPAELARLRKEIQGFEDIGIPHAEAQLYQHLMMPFSNPDVPPEFRRIFPSLETPPKLPPYQGSGNSVLKLFR